MAKNERGNRGTTRACRRLDRLEASLLRTCIRNELEHSPQLNGIVIETQFVAPSTKRLKDALVPGPNLEVGDSRITCIQYSLEVIQLSQVLLFEPGRVRVAAA